jgi:hypothetical protein
MVQTFMCALLALTGTSAFYSYADLVYKPGHVESLLAEEDITVTCCCGWHALCSLRNSNPLNKSDTFLAEKGS